MYCVVFLCILSEIEGVLITVELLFHEDCHCIYVNTNQSKLILEWAWYKYCRFKCFPVILYNFALQFPECLQNFHIFFLQNIKLFSWGKNVCCVSLLNTEQYSVQFIYRS